MKCFAFKHLEHKPKYIPRKINSLILKEDLGIGIRDLLQKAYDLYILILI